MCRVTRDAVARVQGFSIGLTTFMAAHQLEVLLWPIWFGGAHDPWFLNSGRAIAFTMACLFGASLISGILGLSGLMLAAGGITAMTIVLSLRDGSTLFPIVVAIGGLMIASASLLGAWLGSEIRRPGSPKG
jgi:hypothetical protein